MGLGIRLGTVVSQPNKKAGGDPFYFWAAAKLLVEGKWFINPFDYYIYEHGHQVQTAAWPPLLVFIWAIPMLVGFKSYLAIRVWSCILGAVAVVAVGWAGREILNPRVGLIAAFLCAVYPNIWMRDEIAATEAVTPLMIALLLLAAYRFWKRPRPATAAWLGAALAFSMLLRDELSALVILMLVPLVIGARTYNWLGRAKLLGVAVAMIVLFVGPWVGYNLSRFQKPVYISNSLGVTLASANCNATWSGPYAGYWSMACADDVKIDRHADESVQASEYQAHAVKYIESHLDQLPEVTWDRLGRTFGFFRPAQQISYDSYIETVPYHWAMLGLGMYYAFVALSLGGTVVLRRRRVISYPMWVIALTVVMATVIAFGQTRYRISFEVPLVIMSAVMLDWVATRLFGGADGRGARGLHAAGASRTEEPAVVPSPSG